MSSPTFEWSNFKLLFLKLLFYFKLFIFICPVWQSSSLSHCLLDTPFKHISQPLLQLNGGHVTEFYMGCRQKSHPSLPPWTPKFPTRSFGLSCLVCGRHRTQWRSSDQWQSLEGVRVLNIHMMFLPAHPSSATACLGLLLLLSFVKST